MTTLDPAIFKKYDIRGQVGAQINAATATRVAHAFGTHIQRHSGTESNTVYVGHDNRPSSRPLAIAFCQGLVTSGCEVVTLGQVPTPLLYFAVARDENAFGAMITASRYPQDPMASNSAMGAHRSMTKPSPNCAILLWKGHSPAAKAPNEHTLALRTSTWPMCRRRLR